MPPTRVGDTWTFDLEPGVLPTQQVHETLGEVPAETYHATFTGEVSWVDPDPNPETGTFGHSVMFDLDGYDANGALFADFDSNLYARLEGEYPPDPAAHRRFPMAWQSVVAVPAGCILKMSRAANSFPPVPVELIRGRLVLTVVTPTT